MDRSVISFSQLSFNYGNRTVLDGIDFKIHENEFVTIVGPNGGGKTTLLKLILGLIRPQSGDILVFNGPPVKARRSLGYVPQHLRFDPLFPVKVIDVVLMGVRYGGTFFISKTQKAHALKCLADVELEHLASAPFSDLSGGQQQRVLIARALVSKPKILLLDEPTANLDVQVQQDFYELLNKFRTNKTIVLVSHDLEYVANSVDSVICVNKKVSIHPTAALAKESLGDMPIAWMQRVRHDMSCTS